MGVGYVPWGGLHWVLQLRTYLSTSVYSGTYHGTFFLARNRPTEPQAAAVLRVLRAWGVDIRNPGGYLACLNYRDIWINGPGYPDIWICGPGYPDTQR